MTTSKKLVLVMALVALVAASGEAAARGGHGGRRGGFGVGLGVGIGIAALTYPAWGYPRYYYPAPMYAPPMYVAPPPVYIENPQAQMPLQAAPQPSSWYYCGSKQMYYPYTPDCPEGWQPVSPTPQ